MDKGKKKDAASRAKEQLGEALAQTNIMPLAQEAGLYGSSGDEHTAGEEMVTAARAVANLRAPSSPASQGTKREREGEEEGGESDEEERKKAKLQAALQDKGKGLRHFSMRVCNKVRDKGTTTYNEVADELVQEQEEAILRGEEEDDGSNDPKNIRRRVYDALNVLMALKIISKDKKQIQWIGLPTNSTHEYEKCLQQRDKKLEVIAKKKEHLRDLIVQRIAFKNLVKRNMEQQQQHAGAEGGEAAASGSTPSTSIHLPFILLNTDKTTTIDCKMKEDKSEYLFNFNAPFEIHEDMEVLKHMGLDFGLESGACSLDQLDEAKTMIPPALKDHIESLFALPPHPAPAAAAAAAPAASAHKRR